MAGNSQRKGAKRAPGSKKGAVVGSGGAKSKGLRPKGPTPKASDRTKAARRASSPGARGHAAARSGGATEGFDGPASERTDDRPARSPRAPRPAGSRAPARCARWWSRRFRASFAGAAQRWCRQHAAGAP